MSEIADYQATFDLIDVDGDGRISAAELKNLMIALGATEATDEAAVALLNSIDEDGDGLVSLPELAGYLSENAPRS